MEAPSYTTIGQTVIVNYGSPFAFNIGTISNEIEVTVDTGVENELTLNANNIPDGVTMSPNPLVFALGETTQTFTLSAS